MVISGCGGGEENKSVRIKRRYKRIREEEYLPANN